MARLARTLGTGLSWLCAAAALAQPAAHRGMRPALVLDQGQLERREQALSTLLEKSSAARQIETSADSAAQAYLAQAQAQLAAARAALRSGELELAASRLEEVSALMLHGVRRAAQTRVLAAQQREQFEARKASVQALLAADLRIAEEKRAGPEATRTRETVEDLIRQAAALAAADEVAAGKALLDRAYLLVRAAVSTLRRGDVLTRSVQFADKGEEYRYELERNDTHLALLQSLLGQMRAQPEAVAAAADAARAARAQALRQAQAGDPAAAIPLLEDSTRELLRAIRALGIQVPG